MGFFSSLAAESYDRKYTDKELIIRILKYFKPYQMKLLSILVCILVISGTGAAQPVIVSRGVDYLNSKISSNLILLIATIILMIGIVSWFANYARRKLIVRTIADIVATIATQAFQSAVNHDLSFYDEVSSGKVVSRITSDTQDFGQLVNLTTDVLSQIVEALILGIFLLTIDVRLSLYVFAIMPVVLVMAISYRSLARKATQQGMRAMAAVNSTIKETISGIAIAKNFRQELSIYQEFDKANRLSYKLNVRRGLVLSFLFPVLNAMGGMATAVMVYVGGLSVVEGLVTAGAWYLFINSLDRFLFPMLNISSFWTQIQNGLSASERVFSLIDHTSTIKQTDNIYINELKGRIDFIDVDFSYKNDMPVLQSFNLHINPGENIAFVGHTGAGKSSIARLISRFYEFQNGKILVDGHDIRSLDLKLYRRKLGIVSQTPFLFSGTVLDNIRYTEPNVSETEILVLANKVGDGEWLDTLPDGLQTMVGERGSRLSMGQKQLVALMRVLVQKPSIFILDEATASIDPFTEWQIQQALNLILKETTSILIAHRLSTVKSADRIIVLKDGKIIEEGNHQSLLGKSGPYSDLYNTFFRHQSLSYIEESRHNLL